MVANLADLKGLVIVFFVGLAVGWILKSSTQGVAKTSEVSNTEKWDMWEDEQGHIRAVVKRKVKR